MIYLFQELDSFSNEQLSKCLSFLPAWRRDYVLHFKQPQDQKRSVLGWLILSYAAMQEYGIKQLPVPVRSPQGKPFFSEKSMPFFNISHSGTFVGCALHSGEIGLDIQKLTIPRPSLVQRVCTPEELTLVNSPEDFCRIWAMKESAVKLTGEGITGSFRDVFLQHPDIKTTAFPLKSSCGFLAYSTYDAVQLPVVTVTLETLLHVSKKL